jgi:predicted metal-dependent hydrolase
MRLVEEIMNDKVEKYNIPYRVIRSSRRTISVQIAPSGEVLVRCPRRMSNADIRRFVESKSDWIEKHLEKRTAAVRLPVFTDEQLQVLARQARQTIPERVAHFAPLVGVTYGRITIRSQHTLWGSCSGKGNLSFNCLLMLTPPEVLDYVVVHELCHRKEMNHSARFWAEVGRVLPDYEIRRKWLRENGTALISRLER